MSDTSSLVTVRQKAERRLKKRRELWSHMVVFTLVNGFLVVIWAMTTRPGFFWPVFPLFGWGIGLAMHAWDAFLMPEITEVDIDREISRMTRR